MKNRKIDKKISTRNSRGISIVEFMLYFAMTIIIIAIIVQISINTFGGREKIKVQQEIGVVGQSFINNITDDINSADEVWIFGESETEND